MQIKLTATPASLCSGCDTSPLTFVRGWHLTSTSAEFGGLSSLHATPVRRLLAISDSGYWFEFGDGSDGVAPAFASIFELRDGWHLAGRRATAVATTTWRTPRALRSTRRARRCG